METFPAYASVLYQGFAVSRKSAVDRTDMESGPPKQLKRRSRVMVERSVMVDFASKADYQSFITWFQSNINFGADWFTWTDPVDGASKTARIKESIAQETPQRGDSSYWRLSMIIETWSS
jgi:hypothetical protein